MQTFKISTSRPTTAIPSNGSRLTGGLLATRRTAHGGLHTKSRTIDRAGNVAVQSMVYESTLRVAGMQPTSPKAWGIIADTLREANVKVISQQELGWEREKGALIVDIRPEGDFEAGHIAGSVNVSLFRLITGWDPVKTLRRAGFAFFGVFNGTEVNPDFETQLYDIPSLSSQEARETIPLILVCQIGGDLTPTTSFKNGKQSRSMIAAYQLLLLGFKKVSVLKGGFSEWQRNERPIEVADSNNEA